jgi:LAO/AO transport system ATPase
MGLDIAQIKDCIQKAYEGEKFPLAKLISLLENKNSFQNRRIIFPELEKGKPRKSVTIGFTGTPGAGKSSLLGEICKEFIAKFPDKNLAIIAIDPSSTISGGSILGDRTRISIPPREKRIYFRSQASQLELGGVNPYTYHVIRLLRYFFDFILIETVGIGQNEIEVSKLVDHSFLVMQPLAGDNIQFMKSGIMEVPNAFIINKCDEKELSLTSYHMLVNSLEFLKDILHRSELPPIFQTSVLKRTGIEELFTYIFDLQVNSDPHKETEMQLKKWIKNEFGNWGLNEWNSLHSSGKRSSLNFEAQESLFLDHIKNLLPKC